MTQKIMNRIWNLQDQSQYQKELMITYERINEFKYFEACDKFVKIQTQIKILWRENPI